MLADPVVSCRADRFQSVPVKGFFMQQQKGIIGEAFVQIKAGYSNDLAEVNEIAENLQDTYGIKTVISDNGEIVYSSGYSFMLQGQRLGMNPVFHNAEFTSTPTATLIEVKRSSR